MQSDSTFRRASRGHAHIRMPRLSSAAAGLRLQGLLPGDDLGRDVLEIGDSDQAQPLGRKSGFPVSQAQSPFRIVRLSETELMVADPEEDIAGHRIVTRDGESCGIVDDMLVALELRRVLFMLVRLDGRSPGSGRSVIVPVEAIKRTCPENVYLEHALERLRGAPQCDYRAAFPEWSERIYRYFGYPPFHAEQEDSDYFEDSPYWIASRCYSPHLCLPDTGHPAF